jgi:hypothetical protein
MKIFKSILIIQIVVNLTIYSQNKNPFVRVLNDEIKIDLLNGDSYKYPFNGGYNSPVIESQDLTNDGLTDLILMSFDNQIKFYKNNNNFNFVPSNEVKFINSNPNRFIRLVDIDNDSDYDLFSMDASNNLTLQINDSNFIYKKSDVVKSINGESIYITPTTIPIFADIDSDNDLDLFFGTIEGSIVYYENVGSNSNYKFKYITDKFGGISVTQNNKQKDNLKLESLHGASSISFGDIDSDGDLELFFGDYFLNGLLVFKNIGTKLKPIFNTNKPDTAFGDYGDKFSSRGFNTTILKDFDGDKDIDLIACSLNANEVYNTIYFFENKGIITSPNFRQRNVLLNTELDFGFSSSLAFINDKYKNGFIGFGSTDFRYFAEQKNQTNLSFLEGDRFGPTNPQYNLMASIADINNDNVSEILCGDIFGLMYLWVYSEGRYKRADSSNFENIFLNERASPLFFDLDNDSDFDLLIGTAKGKILYYENVGNNLNMKLIKSKTTINLDSINVGTDYSLSVGDINNDGYKDILLGYNVVDSNTFIKYGSLKFLINDGHNSFYENPKFTELTNLPQTPTPALNRYGKYTLLLIGNSSGGVWAFKDTTKYYNSVIENQNLIGLSLYPNVIKKCENNFLYLKNFISKNIVNLDIKIYDLSGCLIENINSIDCNLTNQNFYKININKLNIGTYFLKVNNQLFKFNIF